MSEQRKKQTQTEKLAARNARANRIRREIGHKIGSPYRIHEATERKSQRPASERADSAGR